MSDEKKINPNTGKEDPIDELERVDKASIAHMEMTLRLLGLIPTNKGVFGGTAKEVRDIINGEDEE